MIAIGLKLIGLFKNCNKQLPYVVLPFYYTFNSLRISLKLYMIQGLNPREINPRKFNTKHMCMLAFTAYDKICTVTMTAFDASGVTNSLNTDLLIQQAFMVCIQTHG